MLFFPVASQEVLSIPFLVHVSCSVFLSDRISSIAILTQRASDVAEGVV
jgi:hypothetical protein